MRSTIICVDDEKMLLNILAEQLTEWFGNNYTIEKALGGDDALAILDDCIAQNIDVSVVISDYIMPKMKGDELLEKVRQRNPAIKKIMLTGYSAIEGIISAINRAGLYRYITKPWDNKDLMLTIIEAIKSYEQEQHSDQMLKRFESLYHTFKKYSSELEGTLNTAFEAFSYAVETRFPSISGHSRRVKDICLRMAIAMGLSKENSRTLQYAAYLHDIGRLSIRGDELSDELSIEGFGLQSSESPELIRRQLDCSESIITRIKDSEKIVAAVKYQYENYDGSGIFGLSGDSIPQMSRILRLADSYDTLRNGGGAEVPVSDTIALINDEKGKIFDPMLVDKLREILQAAI